MKLSIGITKENLQWDIILKQAGVSWSVIDPAKEFTDEYSVIIINSFLSKDESRKILKFVNDGGSLLAEAEFTPRILNIPFKKKYIKYLYSGTKIFNHFIPLIDLYRTCSVPSSAAVLNDQEGIPVIAELKQNKGNIVVIPGCLVSAILDKGVLRKKIYSPVKEPPTERVARVSKGSISYLIRVILEYLFHIRNLPFISLWNFPGNSKNIFAFRIDTDYGSEKQVDLLYNTIRENNIKGTWFIETKSAEGWISKYVSFEEQEIGLHCYRHRVFKSYGKNYDNFRKGMEILKRHSLNPQGIAAPFGEWSRSFNRAAEELGFEYSSEFSLSYDSLPHNIDEKKQMLQIPVHPVSFGRLFRAGFSDEEMYNHFIYVINQKIALAEPVIIYTHPLEERYDIHQRIFNFVNSLDLYKIKFSDYAKWWNKRNTIAFNAYIINNEIKIVTETADNSFRLKVVNPGGETFLTPLDLSGRTKMTFPGFSYNPEFNPDPLRRYTYRMFKDDILFFLRKRKL